jgi:two-component system KDP operon response regulator KdpE
VPQESERLQFEDLLIDLEARAAWLSGTRLALTPTEFELLYYLAKRPARVLTHDQLVDHLWGPASSRTRHDLFVHVSRLRKKMEPDPKNPRFIVTRWGIGYVFMPEG